MTSNTVTFEDTAREDGLVKGQLENGEGVVVIEDENWTGTDDDSLKGNWEQITKEILQPILNSADSHAEGQVKLDQAEVVDTLTESDIVSDEFDEEEYLQASLLLQHLVEEGVYERQGEQILVLDEFKSDSDEYNKLNWTAFLSVTIEKIANSIEVAEDQEEKIAKMADLDDSDITTGTDPIPSPADAQSTQELFEDLSRITGVGLADIREGRREDEWAPSGMDEHGMPQPPEGVGDRWEYAKIVNRLNAKRKVGVGKGTDEDETTVDDVMGRLNAKIEQLREYGIEMQQTEKNLRRMSIPDIANIPEVRQTLQTAMGIGSSMFNGNPVGEEDTEEVATGISKLAADQEIADVEEAERETEDEGDGPVETEDEEDLVDDNLEGLFDDEPQHE